MTYLWNGRRVAEAEVAKDICSVRCSTDDSCI